LLYTDMAVAFCDALKGIVFNVFISPLIPSLTREPGEQLQIRTGRASFDEAVDLVRFS